MARVQQGIPHSRYRAGTQVSLNVPRGLGMDVVDAATGIIKTYHLDSGTGFFPSSRRQARSWLRKPMAPRPSGAFHRAGRIVQ